MEYIPGNIHESIRKEVPLLMLNDFIMCLCKNRYSETNLMDDSEFSTIDLKKGDIVILRCFKPPSKWNDSELYSYICSVITDESETIINSESIVSMEFVKLNTENKVLFKMVETEYIRDKKINQILN